MRVSTNHSFPFDRFLPVLAGLGWALALLGLGTAVWLGLSGSQMRAQAPGLAKSLEEAQKAPRPPEVKSFPRTAELSGLKTRLEALNRLGAGGGPSTVALLAGLEKSTPPGVRLVSFQEDRDTQVVQVVAEALSLDKLSRFLENLERSDAFTRVNLTKQAQVADGQTNWIQFSVDLAGSAE